jgi:hypothetical protein
MKTATKPAFGWRGRDRIITVILSLIPLAVSADEPRSPADAARRTRLRGIHRPPASQARSARDVKGPRRRGVAR